jgi:hypothetical protein
LKTQILPAITTNHYVTAFCGAGPIITTGIPGVILILMPPQKVSAVIALVIAAVVIPTIPACRSKENGRSLDEIPAEGKNPGRHPGFYWGFLFVRLGCKTIAVPLAGLSQSNIDATQTQMKSRTVLISKNVQY